jgi:hypothetical protein
MATNNTKEMNDQYLNAFTQGLDDQRSRFESTLAELTERNEQSLEAANVAIGEWAKLAKEAAAMSNQMSTEWLKTLRGTALRAGEMMSTVGNR